MLNETTEGYISDEAYRFLTENPTTVGSVASALLQKTLYERRKLEMCGSEQVLNSSLADGFKFYGCGVTISILACTGTIGNILSFITLATLPKRNLFNKLLLTLTVFDTLFIANGGIFMVQQATLFNNSVYNTFFPRFIYPLAGIAMTGSTYTCIAIAFERFLGICYAHSDIPRHSRYYILAIVCISLIIDFPRFFEIRAVLAKESGKVAFEYSELRKNEFYLTFYTLWFRLFSTAAIPFVLMLFFNLKILMHYRRNSFMNGQNSSSFNNSSHERSLYITFFCLTTTFLICHLPRILLNINELNVNRRRDFCLTQFKVPYYTPTWNRIASCVEKILLIFNSSVNFIFYCLAGKSFRRHLLTVLLPKKVLEKCFPMVSSALERGSLMDSTRTNNHNNRQASVRRGTVDYVLANSTNQRRSLFLMKETEEERIIVEEDDDDDDRPINLIESEEEKGRLLDVRILQQEKPRQSRSELKLFSDRSLNRTIEAQNGSSKSLSAASNGSKSKGENELLGIYDIRITIHRKQLGTAI